MFPKSKKDKTNQLQVQLLYLDQSMWHEGTRTAALWLFAFCVQLLWMSVTAQTVLSLSLAAICVLQRQLSVNGHYFHKTGSQGSLQRYLFCPLYLRKQFTASESSYCGKTDWRKFNLEFDPLRARNWSQARRSVSELTLKVFLRATPDTSSLYTTQRAIKHLQQSHFYRSALHFGLKLCLRLDNLHANICKLCFCKSQLLPPWTRDEAVVNTLRKERLDDDDGILHTVLLRLGFWPGVGKLFDSLASMGPTIC